MGRTPRGTRPTHEDFLAVWATHSRPQLEDMFGVSKRTIEHLIVECGGGRARSAAVRAHERAVFVERAKTMTVDEMANVLGVEWGAVRRMEVRTGVACVRDPARPRIWAADAPKRKVGRPAGRNTSRSIKEIRESFLSEWAGMTAELYRACVMQPWVPRETEDCTEEEFEEAHA